MDLDLTKLTPAPWTFCDHEGEANWDVSADIADDVLRVADGISSEVGEDQNMANLAFIAIARNAFDVMMRRGWFVVPNYCNRPGTFWRVKTGLAGDLEIDWKEWSDPFTALVKADAWYRENVEKSQCSTNS